MLGDANLTATWTVADKALSGIQLTNATGETKVYNSKNKLVTGTEAKKQGFANVKLSSASPLDNYVGQYTLYIYGESTTTKKSTGTSAVDATSRMRLALGASAEDTSISAWAGTAAVTLTINITADGKLWSAQSYDAKTDAVPIAAATGINFRVGVAINGGAEDVDRTDANEDTAVSGRIGVSVVNNAIQEA